MIKYKTILRRSSQLALEFPALINESRRESRYGCRWGYNSMETKKVTLSFDKCSIDVWFALFVCLSTLKMPVLILKVADGKPGASSYIPGLPPVHPSASTCFPMGLFSHKAKNKRKLFRRSGGRSLRVHRPATTSHDVKYPGKLPVAKYHVRCGTWSNLACFL